MIISTKRFKFLLCLSIIVTILIFLQNTAICDTSKIININESIELILLTNEENENYGYILTDVDDQNNIKIIEYGYGKDLPYTDSKEKLVYSTPFENYYIKEMNNEIAYIEGFSKEWLPDLKNLTLSVNRYDSINANEPITDSYINYQLCFNPYHDLSWLLSEEFNKDLTIEEIKKFLKADKKILFSGSKYGTQVQFAYSVVGFHQYNNNVYLALHDSMMDLIRFISFEDINRYGNFQVR